MKTLTLPSMQRSTCTQVLQRASILLCLICGQAAIAHAQFGRPEPEEPNRSFEYPGIEADLRVSADGARLALATSKGVYTWNVKTMMRASTLEIEGTSFHRIAQPEGDRLYALGLDGNDIVIRDAFRPLDPEWTRVEGGGAYLFALSPGGSAFAMAREVKGKAGEGDGRRYVCVVYDIRQRKPIAEWDDFKETITALDLSPDAKTVAVAVGKNVTGREVPSGKLRWTIPEQRGSVGRIVFSPDGNVLATRCGDEIVRMSESGPIKHLSFGDDGRTDLRAHVWNIQDSPVREISDLGGNDSRICSLAFSGGAMPRIVTAGGTDQVREWDSATGSVLFRWPAEDGGGIVAVSADGRSVWLADDGRVRSLRIRFPR